MRPGGADPSRGVHFDENCFSINGWPLRATRYLNFRWYVLTFDFLNGLKNYLTFFKHNPVPAMPKPNTFSQTYIHVVFAVKGRANVIKENQREQVQRYITGIVQNRKVKVLAIFCRPDHIHILISINPTTLVADLVRDIKTNSTIFI